MHKRTNLQAFLSLCMVVMLAVSTLVVPTQAADDSEARALDVMFVVDSSGSMLSTDPNRIAMAASNLFADMCDYDEARAGFVAYDTQAKVQGLTSLSSESNRRALKNAINGIKYTNRAGTDIALGLEKAADVLVTAQAKDPNRVPVIILVSDGETDGLDPVREAQYDQAYANVLNDLKNAGIPVYTIAVMSKNGDTSEETMEEIANATGGICFTADQASDLDDILTDIMANLVGTKKEEIANIEGTGGPQTVDVEIPSDGIYEANIIIFSSKGVSGLRLQEPGGNDVAIPSSKVLQSRSNSYDLIKIKNPNKGTWKLTLTGANKDKIIINLVNNHAMQLTLTADRTTVPNNSAVSFSVLSATGAGGEIFDGAEGKLNITSPMTGDVDPKPTLNWNGSTEMTGAYTFTRAGTYTVSAHIVGKDGSYDRITEEIKITVEPQPLQAMKSNTIKRATCFSPFLGIRLMNKVELPMSKYFTWDQDAKPIQVNAVSGNWADVCSFDYDEPSTTATIRAEKSGTATVDLNVSDSFGQNATYTVRLTVIPGWVPFVLIILLAGLIVALVFIIKKATAPRLKGTLKISVSMPSELSALTPPEAEIDLSILNKKGKVPLMAVLASNLTLSTAYTQALEGIAGFVGKIQLEAADKNCSSLRMHIPPAGNGAAVQFNNAPITNGAKKNIVSGMPAQLSYSAFNGIYGITFNFGDGGFTNIGFDSTGGFGGTGGGFGGGNDGGFGGGFGGGNDGGFGGGFGGGNDGGFGGGFGGGNDGGFGGGFGGGNDGGFGGGFGGGNNGGFGGNNGGFGGGNDGGFGGFGGGNGGNGFNAF